MTIIRVYSHVLVLFGLKVRPHSLSREQHVLGQRWSAQVLVPGKRLNLRLDTRALDNTLPLVFYLGFLLSGTEMFWNVLWEGGYKDGVQHKEPDPGLGWDGS